MSAVPGVGGCAHPFRPAERLPTAGPDDRPQAGRPPVAKRRPTACQPRHSRAHALVRRRQRHAYEVVARLAVEVARRDEDAEVGQVGHRGPSRTRRGWPRGRGCASLCSMRKPWYTRASRSRARRAVYRSRCSWTWVSSPRAATTAAWVGADVIMPPCLRISRSGAEDGRVAGEERGAVARQVGPLGERVDGDDPVVGAAVHVRVQDGDRVGLPAQLQVALVGEEQDAVLAGPGDDPGQLGLGEDLAGGVGRRVQPEELQAGRVQLVGSS